MATIAKESKDPSDVQVYYFIWCDIDGTNDGSATDNGALQGETISSRTVTVPSGITKNSDAVAAVTIRGVSYGINTVVSVVLSGGTADTDYDILCEVVTSGGRTLQKTLVVPVRQH